MGWNPDCGKCKQPKQTCGCQHEEVIEYVEETPCNSCSYTKEMSSVPVISTEYVNDFDINNTNQRYMYTFVFDVRNGRTYFFDIFGVGHLISDFSRATKAVDTIVSKKQNKIEDYTTSKSYAPNDLVIKDGKIYQAKEFTIGEFKPQSWKQIGL